MNQENTILAKRIADLERQLSLTKDLLQSSMLSEATAKQYAEEVDKQNKELAAQIEALRVAALNAISFMSGGEAKAQLRDAYDATPQQHLAELRAAAAKAALLKLADEYRPFGLRHSYTAFDVANHVSAQAEYYADSIRRGEVNDDPH